MNALSTRAPRLAPRALAAGLLALAALARAGDASDLPFKACWRAQQTQIRFEGDPRIASINFDCVQTLGADGRLHIACDGAGGRSETTYKLEATGPGTFRATADAGDHRAVEYHWHVDDRWLMTSSPAQLPPDCNCTKPGVQTQVWVRVDDPARCEPRGAAWRDRPTLLQSSIVIAPPAGWVDKPYVTPPPRAFVIGLFVPANGPQPVTRWVEIRDLMSDRAEPVLSADFGKLRRQFVDALTSNGGVVDCDLPDRACIISRRPEGMNYTEIVDVDGRGVTIDGVSHDSGAAAEDALRLNVQRFTDAVLMHDAAH